MRIKQNGEVVFNGRLDIMKSNDQTILLLGIERANSIVII